MRFPWEHWLVILTELETCVILSLRDTNFTLVPFVINPVTHSPDVPIACHDSLINQAVLV